MIDGRSNFSGGSVDQTETHIARWVFNAVEIARDAAIGSEQHDATGVSEEVVRFVKGVTEICRGGQRVNALLFSGEKMPSGRSLGAAVARQGSLFFLGGHKRSFARIKAGKHRFVVASRMIAENIHRA